MFLTTMQYISSQLNKEPKKNFHKANLSFMNNYLQCYNITLSEILFCHTHVEKIYVSFFILCVLNNIEKITTR